MAILLAVPPIRVGAQAIQGRVLDADTEQAIATADVAVLDTLGEARAVALTDSTGAFRLAVPGPGTYRLQATHLAYDTTISQAIEVGAGELVEVELRLGGRAIPLDPLLVVARRPIALHLRRYHDRLERYERMGRGVFITREDLARMPAMTVGHAVTFHALSAFRNARGQECRPSVYWNGLPMGTWDRIRSEGAEIPVSAIEGIEVYYARRVEVPAEYLPEPCGVILLWGRALGPGEGTDWSLWRVAAFLGAVLGFSLLLGH